MGCKGFSLVLQIQCHYSHIHVTLQPMAGCFGQGVAKGCQHQQRPNEVPCHGGHSRWLPGLFLIIVSVNLPDILM